MITQEESDAGLRAYEQTLAFASLRRKRLPLIYVVFPILLAIMGVAAGLGAAPVWGVVCVLCAVLFSIFAVWNWRRLRALDGRNRALLAELHTKYGDDLPWLQVERQLAEIRKIQAEQDRLPSD
jgi:Flp pilus assembly protein TadB